MLYQHFDFNVTIIIFLGFDMSNLVGCTNSYIAPDGPPQHPPEFIDDEWLLMPFGALGPAADAARLTPRTQPSHKENAGCEQLLICIERTPQEAQERQKTEDYHDLQGPLLLLLDCRLLLLAQLSVLSH